MAAAKDIFVRQGYHDTSLADIAGEARVATLSLYKAYGDKDGLFRGAMDEIESEYPAISLDIGPDDTFFSALQRTATHLLDIAMRPRSAELMQFLVGESKQFPDITRRSITDNFTRLCGNLHDIFERLAADGIVSSVASDRLAPLFIDAIVGMRPMLAHLSVPLPPVTAADIDERVEFFIRGAFGEPAAIAARSRRLTSSDRAEAQPEPSTQESSKRRDEDAT